MKKVLYILVTLALFSYILAMPADSDSDLKKRDTSEAREEGKKIEDKGKESEKEGPEKKNESTNGKQQPDSGMMEIIQIPFKLAGGLADMGAEMFGDFAEGLEKGMDRKN
ncbi:hypothetical protein O0L34_g8883 [Tuta absoluta]|nr:hypothetical protein O0L34_g8883 [Tuta absoluta]